MPLRFTLLGAMSGASDGDRLMLGGAKQKTVLALLVLARGRSVSREHITAGVWGDDPPGGASATLQVFVSNLRRVLGPDGPSAISFDGHGYALRLPCEADVFEFDQLCQVAEAEGPEGAARTWRQALALFRGEPLGGLEGTEIVRREQIRLSEARCAALEGLFDAELATGRHREVLPDIVAAVDEHPLREQLWSTLMIALYRSGRQAEALRAYQQLRDRMVHELGIEPSPEVRRLEQLILEQDSGLAVAPAQRERAHSTIDMRAATPSQAYLELEDGRVVKLIRRVTLLGRDETADVSIQDRRVSRQHAVIRSRGDEFEIVDDRSTNGTEVNGAVIASENLRNGDVIGLGGFQIRFVR